MFLEQLAQLRCSFARPVNGGKRYRQLPATYSCLNCLFVFLVWSFVCLFFYIIFLSIIQGFHTMHPNHIYFPVLSCLCPTFVTSSSKNKIKNKKKKLQFVLSLYSLERGAWLNSHWAAPVIELSPSTACLPARGHQF